MASNGSNNVQQWAIRVRHPSGATRTYPREFGPQSLLSDLRAVVERDLNLGGQEFHLAIGLPPRSIPHQSSDPNLTLESAGLKNAEVVHIIVSESPKKGSSANGAPKGKKETVSKKTSTKRRKQKEVTSSSEEEEELVLETDSEDEAVSAFGRQRASRTSRPSPVSSSSAAARPAASDSQRKPRTFGARIATLHQPRNSKKLKSEEEVGEKLASSFEAGESRDSVAKFFRRLTRGEVVKAYEIAAANAKLHAVLQNQYEITPMEQSSYRLADGVPMEVTLKVKYKKGPRSWGEETVQGLSEDLLRESIRSVLRAQVHPDDMLSHPREGLRPFALPLISPRVFWSLVHRFGGGDDCILRALRTLLPLESWGFLGTRTRRETERARQWRHTESVLDSLERGAARRQQAAEDADSDDDDELSEVIESKSERKKIRGLGIGSILKLAAVDADAFNGEIDDNYIQIAREITIERLMDTEILHNASSDVRTKLNELDIKTPSDVARLRIPGRTQMVVEETQVDPQVVEDWKKRAEDLCREHPWLSDIRTRG